MKSRRDGNFDVVRIPKARAKNTCCNSRGTVLRSTD